VSESPRIAPGTRREIGFAATGFSRIAGRVMGTTPPNIFTTLSRTKTLFWGWLIFAGRLMPGGKLSRRQSELVILRVAGLRGSEYELVQHRLMGRRVGLTPDEIERAEHGSNEDWSPSDLTLMEATDMLIADKDLTDERWDALRAHFNERTCIEFLMLAGHYDLLATVLGTLRVVPDQPRR